LYGRETWSLTFREEHRLVVFENRVLRKIFGPKRVEVTREWKRLHNEELHGLVPLRKYFTDDQIKENAVGKACGVCEGKEECVQSFDGET
jgi:hypothetical protein